MNAIRRADALVADRLRLAAERERLPGPAVGTTAADVAAAVSAGSPHADRFRAEIASAVAGTALALDAARPHPADLWAHAAAAHPDPTVWFEQAVLLGHPTHPLARTRGELTASQTRAYAPEHRPRLTLGLHRLPGLDAAPDWPAADEDGPLLPVHPWQAHRRRLDPPETTWTGAAPLMSLRTLSTGRHHVKCAVDLQLTSAVRHVSPAAVHNGPLIGARLAGPAARHGITLLTETAAAVHGPDGPRSDLAAVIRPAPHRIAGDRIVPLAALAEPCPATGRPIAAALAGEDLDRWWTALLEAVLAPLRLLAATGAALEAHGQNLLVAFDADRPSHVLYRDFGGIRLPRAHWPGLRGAITTDDEDERIRKLLAALLPTTLTALVEALAAWTGTDPGRWWKTVADAARSAAAASPAVTAAVFAPTWPIKATTAMRLAENPLEDLWTSVPNPLADA
ncbi:MAG TPA: IucA/IucC family protein [Glycomyces sp.]|nr:IucA/IucC family protein [Glycomyces sp.]